jgi:hypothetical protein
MNEHMYEKTDSEELKRERGDVEAEANARTE